MSGHPEKGGGGGGDSSIAEGARVVLKEGLAGVFLLPFLVFFFAFDIKRDPNE